MNDTHPKRVLSPREHKIFTAISANHKLTQMTCDTISAVDSQHQTVIKDCLVYKIDNSNDYLVLSENFKQFNLRRLKQKYLESILAKSEEDPDFLKNVEKNQYLKNLMPNSSSNTAQPNDKNPLNISDGQEDSNNALTDALKSITDNIGDYNDPNAVQDMLAEISKNLNSEDMNLVKDKLTSILQNSDGAENISDILNPLLDEIKKEDNTINVNELKKTVKDIETKVTENKINGDESQEHTEVVTPQEENQLLFGVDYTKIDRTNVEYLMAEYKLTKNQVYGYLLQNDYDFIQTVDAITEDLKKGSAQ